MKFKLADGHEVGRGDGPNPFDEDDIEWDADPHASKRGTVLKTVTHKGYEVVLLQGHGLWVVKTLNDRNLPPKLQGKFTTLREAMKAVDVSEGDKH